MYKSKCSRTTLTIFTAFYDVYSLDMPYFENVTDHRRKVWALYGKEEIGETTRQAMRVILYLININLLKTSLGNGGSLANVALSSIKLIMLANSDLLECLHLMFMICLFNFYSVCFHVTFITPNTLFLVYQGHSNFTPMWLFHILVRNCKIPYMLFHLLI